MARAGRPKLTRPRSRAAPPVVVPPTRLSLQQARLEALDSIDRSEFLHLAADGWGHPRVYDLSRPSPPQYGRYDDLLELADRTLRARLSNETWLATGRDPSEGIDAPRKVIPSDRFPYLEFDFDKSALQGDRVRIIEVSVSPVGALHLFELSKQARLGALYLELSEQSFKLLFKLAEWAKRGQPLVPNEKLRAEVFPNATNLSALGQGVTDLWAHLERSGMTRGTARSLVINVPRRGYYLNLVGLEIFLHD